MVAADTRGLRIETLVIRRRTAGDEHTCAMPRELASDASTNAFGPSSHHCGSALKNHVRKCIGPGGGCLGKDGQAPAVRSNSVRAGIGNRAGPPAYLVAAR